MCVDACNHFFFFFKKIFFFQIFNSSRSHWCELTLIYLFPVLSKSKWSAPNFCWNIFAVNISASKIPTNENICITAQVWSQSNRTLIKFAACLSCLSVRPFSDPVPMYADLGTKAVFWVRKVGGWGRQLPVGTWGRRRWRGKKPELASCLPCSLLYCTAAVSAGMAPLTICSLIANIRVHFLRHWTGTERLPAVLWAFLSLSLPFLLNL